MKVLAQVRIRVAAVLLLLVALVSSLQAPGARAAEAFPATVRAKYTIDWNGIDIGQFMFLSNVENGKYTLSGDAKLEALFGAFKWRGITRTLGAFAAGKPKPSTYSFKFEGNDKSGRVDMKFGGGTVKVSAIPPVKSGPGRIPVTKDQLAGVLDPLSAIVFVSGAGGPVSGKNPCKRTVPIFDGRQRFDLILSYRRRDTTASGRETIVCKVKFEPISGHKMNDQMKFMATTDGIEIWLMPVGEANVFIPHRIVVPTWAGSATLTSTSVQIDMPGRGKIALN